MRVSTVLFGLSTFIVSLGGAQSAFAGPLSVCVNGRTGAITVEQRCPLGTKKQTLSSLLVRSIPKGATVYGVIGGRFTASAGGETFVTMESLPAKTSPVFNAESDVQIGHTAGCAASSNCLSQEEEDVASVCTGSAAVPTAPAGKVCIYPVARLNARFAVGYHVLDGSNGNAPAPASFSTGFRMGWESIAAGESSMEAVWAYTAP